MRKAALLSTVLAALSSAAHAEIIADGYFSKWDFNATGTAVVNREATGGHSDARLNISTVSGPLVYGTAIKTDLFSNGALEGRSFTLSLDVLSGPGDFGEGQNISLLVEQNSTLYGQDLGITSFPHNWDTLTFGGAFTAGAFIRLIGSGPNQPDFAGGVPTFFGFAGSNSISRNLTQYYDNFRLESSPLQVFPTPPCMVAVPEPGSFLLMLVGMAYLVVHARRARRSRRD